MALLYKDGCLITITNVNGNQRQIRIKITYKNPQIIIKTFWSVLHEKMEREKIGDDKIRGYFSQNDNCVKQ